MRTSQSQTQENSPSPTSPPSPEPRVPVQAKLAAAWTSFMFLYIYVDHLGLYKPGLVEDMLNGKVYVFDVSPALMILFLGLMAIEIFTIMLSMTLPARASRAVNLAVAAFNIPYAAFNVTGGGPWTPFYVFALALELVILAYILRTAWTWRPTAAAS